MSVVVPNGRLERVQFYESHVAPLAAHATQVGLAPADVDELAALAADARAAYDEQQALQQAARAATLRFNTAVGRLGACGAALLKRVRATAAMSGDPNVYSLAEIPAPASPAPLPAPGKPTALEVALDATGALLLSWTCRNPRGTSGTIYQVYRAVGASEDFTYLGGVGERSFRDDTIPPGATRLAYRLQAVRSTLAGPWATFAVSFGSGAAAVRLAA